MSALIGSTGFVGGHLQTNFEFTHKYNRANIYEIQGLNTDLLICAGLPAEKWKANSEAEMDWSNTTQLAQMITSVKAERAILISTIDVYQPAIDVTEEDSPNYNGVQAYGRNRAWFEAFFTSHFRNSHVVRLPGLFGDNLRKNLIYDLLHKREEQYVKTNFKSEFQFFDISQIWNVINLSIKNDIKLINVATEPISAQEIADVFECRLGNSGPEIIYKMKTIHSKLFQENSDYVMSKEDVMNGISRMITRG